MRRPNLFVVSFLNLSNVLNFNILWPRPVKTPSVVHKLRRETLK